jgi:hypothetical protein
MLSFLSSYGVWILLIGGMLLMHRGHGGGHSGGHSGGCGAGHTSHTSGKQPATSDHADHGEIPKHTVNLAKVTVDAQHRDAS